MIPADQTAAELVPIAIDNRPEIASQRELLAAANQRLKQEKKRPFLPNLIIVNPSTATGLLAAGNLSQVPNAGLGADAHSAAFEVAAVWELQNAGLGDLGLIRQAGAGNDLASMKIVRTLFRVQGRGDPGAGPPPDRSGSRLPRRRRVCGRRRVGRQNFIGLRETTRPAGELLRLVVRPQEDVAAIHCPQRGLRAILRGCQRVQRGAVRALSRAGAASPMGHLATVANSLDPARWKARADARGRAGVRRAARIGLSVTEWICPFS